jgi:hypothetical protein
MPHPAVAQIWLALARVSIPTVSKVHVNVKTIPDLEIFEARLNVSMARPSGSKLGSDMQYTQTCDHSPCHFLTLTSISSPLHSPPPRSIPRRFNGQA